jgi:ABC-type multidrug transport system permease subunit
MDLALPEPNWLWLVAFLAGFIMDFMWILWMWATEKCRPWIAGWVSLSQYAIGLFAIVEVIHNKEFCIPLFAGYFLGSVAGVYWKKRRQENSEH